MAIRLLPADLAGDLRPRRLDRAGARRYLSHANAITLFDAGVHDRRVYVAFELISGRRCASEMAGRPMNARRAVELAIQITDAVAEAHALGFLHGGLSPDTIDITAKGHAKIPAFHLGTQIGFDPSAATSTAARLRFAGGSARRSQPTNAPTSIPLARCSTRC